MRKLKEIINTKGLDEANMPQAPSFIAKSFLFLKSTENINTPGELVAEMFRETFYEKHYNDIRPNGSRLDPKCIDLNGLSYKPYTEGEVAVLEIFRGSLKKNSNIFSYTPSYPQLMRNAWLRAKHGRNIRNHFFGGALAQALFAKDHHTWVSNISNFSELYFKACVGNKSFMNSKEAELLDALRYKTAIPDHNCFNSFKEVDEKIKEFAGVIKDKKDVHQIKNVYNLKAIGNQKIEEFDRLPYQILNDFRIILSLENSMPRIEWIINLSNYLRVAVPAWVFATSNSNNLLYNAIISIIDEGMSHQEAYDIFLRKFAKRNEGIFICSETPNSGGEDWVKEFGKKRVLLSLLIYLLESIFKEDNVMDKIPDFEITSTKSEITLLDFFVKVWNNRGLIIQKVNSNGSNDLDSFLRRSSEDYSIYRNPGKSGITKNLKELLRVLREPEDGFDSGGLLKPNKRGNIIDGYFVFPQPSLLRLFTYLANKNQVNNKRSNVQELIDHFGVYGIDFSKSNQARLKLKSELLHLGLLKGSPDAGLEAELSSPF